MNNSIIIYLKKLFVLILIIVFIDVVLGKTLEHFYFKMKSGQSSRITYAMTQSQEDVVVFGSSRANHHYVTTLLEDSLHTTAYNAGIDGQGILFQYSLLKAMQSRYQPKVIILDLNPDGLEEASIYYDRLYVLLPYYKRYKEIQPIVNVRSPYEHLKAMSTLYRYNYFILPILYNNILNKSSKEDIKGYEPLYKNIDLTTVKKAQKKVLPLDSIKVANFRSFIKEANRNNCKVMVYISPIFKTYGVSPTIAMAKKICSDEGVFFKDYSSHPFFKESTQYFHDFNHLNNSGAEAYSRIISGEIKILVSSKL